MQGSIVIEAARDVDEDVAFQCLTHYALGIITREELFYKLSDLILQSGTSPLEHDVTRAMAWAFDAYREKLASAVMANRAPAERRIQVYPVHDEPVYRDPLTGKVEAV